MGETVICTLFHHTFILISTALNPRCNVALQVEITEIKIGFPAFEEINEVSTLWVMAKHYILNLLKDLQLC